VESRVTPYDPETVVLGVVGRPHGVHGEVWLRPHNVLGTPFETLRALVLERDGVRTPYGIEVMRPTPDGAIAKLAGVDTREAAAALTLCEVRVPRAALAPLGPGEYYVGDVVGCAVVHDSGRALGVVASTFWNGAQDVMVVVAPDEAQADAETLIPLVPQFVVTVDAPGRKIVVSWDGHD
jgi:16S rRNA processing protein RimM